jgi:hypothetical protein
MLRLSLRLLLTLRRLLMLLYAWLLRTVPYLLLILFLTSLLPLVRMFSSFRCRSCR